MRAAPFNPARSRAQPVDAAPTAADFALVAGWRRLRMSWSSVGCSLGISEADARRRFDPTWPGVKQ